ncbi:MAG: bifunctional diaminohydroxyphosphoribosylaminopyrimidine deaminase/5-amino-6-(5-phosphoribosylamino)uracil reductase RibD [Amphiplicatus sp.]
MGDDARYMTRALALAERAAGFTAPNPMVGCVIVKDGEIVGEGWHRAAGAPHAEAEALAAAGAKARGATVYVTLEPCNHHGLTPPCSEALIKASVAEVVYALPDPNAKAAGGAARLAAGGIKVRHEVCAKEAAYLNRFWLKSITSDRPYVVAKFAMSLDGKIATRAGASQWITGPKARARAHQLRQSVDAIIVGAGTLAADDPALTARPEGRAAAHPLRIVLDSSARSKPGAKAFERGGKGALLVTTRAATRTRLEAFRGLGVETLCLSADERGRPDLGALLEELKARGACGVLVEGGGETLGAFFDVGLVDEVWAFIAPIVIGGGKPAVGGAGVAALADAWSLQEVETERLGRDLLLRGVVNRRPR